MKLQELFVPFVLDRKLDEVLPQKKVIEVFGSGTSRAGFFTVKDYSRLWLQREVKDNLHLFL